MLGLQTKVVLKVTPLACLQVNGVSDSSLMNVDGGASQAGLFVLGAGADIQDKGFGDVPLWGCRSPKHRRKVCSTLSGRPWPSARQLGRVVWQSRPPYQAGKCSGG